MWVARVSAQDITAAQQAEDGVAKGFNQWQRERPKFDTQQREYLQIMNACAFI